MSKQTRPHVILINPDQWRGDALGHMGHPAAQTPVLDAWARDEAVSFRHAYCQNPVCTPSRCSFMTGWYPHVRGHRTMFHMLQPDEPCLLRTLKQNDYHVWWGGKNDLIPAQDSYDDYCTERYRSPTGTKPMAMSDRSAEWRGEPGSDAYYSFQVGQLDTGDEEIYRDSDWANVYGAVEAIRNCPPGQPLGLFLALTYPHPPYGVEDPWFSAINRSDLPDRIAEAGSGKPSLLAGIRQRQGLDGWTEERWDELRATYLGMCARVDHQIGLILDALRETGMYDDALVMVFSDHGDFTGDYGLVEKTQNTFEDCLVRVPLLVKPPIGHPVAPRVSNAMVELIDIPATVEDVCSITPSHTHFGRSLLPLLAGDETGREAVFCEGGRLAVEEHTREAQSAGAHDPGNLYWPRVNLQVTDVIAHTKAVMCRTERYKYVRRLYKSDELYDMETDPHELRNRIDDPNLASVAQEMRDRLLTHFLESTDAVPFQTDRRGF